MRSLLDYLREDGVELKKDGPRWVAICPFHSEKTPSFTVELEKGDGGLYKCFGCGEGGDAVTYLEKARKLSKKEALRLHKGPPSGEGPASRASGHSSQDCPEIPPRRPPFVTALPRDALGVWDYRDADGRLRFKVVRRPPKDGKKVVRPYTPARKGGKQGWVIKNLMETGRPLYRLPELLAADHSQQVMLVEGEKCADAVLSAFPTACVTTWSHGTNSWCRTDFSPLFGRDVLCVADADKSGRKAMTAIADLLVAHESTVRVVLPEGETGDDIADEIEKGGAKGATQWLRGLAKDYEHPKHEVANEPGSGEAADTLGADDTADAPDESAAPCTPDTPDGAETADTPCVNAASDAANTAANLAWTEALLEQAKKAPGAPFKRKNKEALRRLMRDNVAAWEDFRADLRDKTKVRLAKLDKALNEKSEDVIPSRSQGKLLIWQDDELWHDQVYTAELLNTIAVLIRRYMHMSNEQVNTLACWLLYSWVHDQWNTSTFLGITSATRRCGKTRLLSIIGALAFRPLSLSTQTTSPALFRTIEMCRPTLILDEIDRHLHQDPELIGLINGSQEKSGSFALRMVKKNDDFEPGTFRTWCPKVLAGIGNLPSTIRDRSILINLQRRNQSADELQFWGDRDEAETRDIRRKLARWTKDYAGSIYRKRNTLEFPPGLHDRARDGWAPLFTIGEFAGGDWGSTAGYVWRACEKITASTEDDSDIGEMLLKDIRKVYFKEGDPPHMATGRNDNDLYSNQIPRILPTLIAMDDRPWAEYTRDRRPLTSSGLAKRLKYFNIAPRTIRLGTKTAKGYRFADFVPVWESYGIGKPEDDTEPIG